MLTLENMAVKCTEDGSQKVVLAFKNITDASNKTRGALTQSFAATGAASSQLGGKLTTLASTAAFSFTQIAEGEKSIGGLAKGLSSLGFLAGPAIGALTTLAGVLVAQVADGFFKSGKEAEEAAKKVLEFNRALGASGSLMQASKRAQQLYSGDEFSEDETPLGKLIKGGGLE